MPRLMKVRSLLRNIFSFRSVESDLNKEIDSHLQMLIEENVRSGMPPEEAERTARIELGGAEQVKEQVREVRIGSWLHSVASDATYGLRQLRKNPGFCAVAVGTLAMAVGANTVVFAALNALILRPLDLPRAESLYSIHRVSDNSSAQSVPGYQDLRGRNHSFEDIAAYNIVEAGLNSGDRPASVWIFLTSGNYFDVLKIRPHLGRFYRPSDEHGPNSAPYAVLTHAYWHAHFHEDRSVVGRTILINKHPFTIIGVAPPGFHGTILFFSPDFFVPMVNQQQIEGTDFLNARGTRWIFMTLGHLKPGVTPQQAAADLNSIGAFLEHAYPKDHTQMKFVLSRPSLYGEYLGRPIRAFLTALMLLAGLILLAACANLGSLFAARASDRSRELALRLALGAGRMRIMRQLLTEALLISIIGGAAGMWSSIVLLGWLRAWQPFPQFPINVPVSVDAYVYGVAALLTLAAGFLFGAVPVRQVLQTDPYEIVKSGSIAKAGRKFTGRDVLLVTQIAICAVLITSSIVAVRGLIHSLKSNLGFQPRDAMLVDTILDMAGYSAEEVPSVQKRMIEAMQTIPGVTAVGLTDWAPLTANSKSSIVFTDQTADLRPANAAATAETFKVSPDYFRAAQTPLLSGRIFTRHDDERTQPVAIINEEFARRIFGTATNPIGRYFQRRDGTRVQVVGIVPDGKYENLVEDQQPAVYFSILQFPSSQSTLIVRSNANLQELAAAVRNKLREVDAGLPAYIQTWNKGLDFALFPSRVASVALGVLGGMGAMLSLTGIFGMAAYSVSKRMRELGIRMALGAQRKQVLQAALGRSVKLLLYGSATGLLLGILGSGVLASIVYQATPRDPLVLISAVVAMASLGVFATWLPARRALSVEPLILLREQ